MPDNRLHDLTDPTHVTFAPMFQLAHLTAIANDGWSVRTAGNTEVVKVHERMSGSSFSVGDLVLITRTWNHRWIILGKLEQRS